MSPKKLALFLSLAPMGVWGQTQLALSEHGEHLWPLIARSFIKYGVAGGWAYGTSTASWSTSTPLENTYYTVWAESSVIEYYSYYNYDYQEYIYEDQYGYSLLGGNDGTPDLYELAPVVYIETVYQVVAMDWAYSVANATSNPPSVVHLDLWSGETGPGGSGYWVLYGAALSNVFGPTSSSTDCSGVSVSPTWAGPDQVNLSFSISGSTPSQTCNVTVWTPNGSSSIPVNVGFSFTSIQHDYPRNPLPQACRITSFFDASRFGHAHHAQDLVHDNGSGGKTVPAYGTPVTAMEAGTVTAAVSG